MRVTGNVGISEARDYRCGSGLASGESPSEVGTASGPRVSDSHTNQSLTYRSSVEPPVSDSTATCCSVAVTNLRKCWGVYFRSDTTSHPARRYVLTLCFFSFLLTVAVNFSKPSVEQVFRMSQLCWNAVKESEFESGWLVSHWVCILVVLHVLQHRLHVSNVYLAMIGCVSAICALVIFSAATLPDISDNVSNILVFACELSVQVRPSL